MINKRHWQVGRGGTALLSVISALLFAVGFFVISTWEISRVEGSQRSQLIEMTDGFVSVFAENRGDGAPVPAKFRRMGIEQFTNNKSNFDSRIRTTVRMPGRPGFEVQTRERDLRIGQIIQNFVDEGLLDPVQEHRFENERLIGRTIFPSVANNQSCVSCHNEILGSEIYQIGDIMGAYVVESDLTEPSMQNAFRSIAVFGAALLVFGALATREQRRMKEVVTGLEVRIELEKEKLEAEAHARFLTSHDALTGLPNRTMFRERLEIEMSGHSTSGLIVVLLDLDEFKTVNDTIGHAAGDALLTEVALRLRRVVKENDGLVARIGGDEYGIVFRTGNLIQSASAAGRAILDALHPIYAYKEFSIQPRASIGILQISNGNGLTLTEILQFADAALYEAKSEGKNLYKIFDESIKSSLARRTEIAALLPEAILSNDMRVVLQPKLCLSTGEFKGFEALARWRLDGEEVSPEEFVLIAEKIGLIRELDLGVLRAAAEFAAQQAAATGQLVPLSTNISALNFRSAGLAEAIQKILWQTKLRPDLLTLEITESAAVENWQAVQDVLNILRPLGVRASLDDFGTGYSSLSYLRRFRFEEIKIDRDFIADIENDKETRFLFESIVDMAVGLGSSLVVEGIETKEQARIVAEKGAQIGQGYLFSHPLEIAEAAVYLQRKFGLVPTGNFHFAQR